MRRLGRLISTILIWAALASSIGFAAIWHRTLHVQDSIQYITQEGTAYSAGTGIGSITFSMATRYPELLRGIHADWLLSTANAWSGQSFTYDVPYTKPLPTTRPSDPPRMRTHRFQPAPWNSHRLGFDNGSGIVPLRSGGAGAISRSFFFTLPLWFLMLLTAAPSIIWLRFRMRG